MRERMLVAHRQRAILLDINQARLAGLRGWIPAQTHAVLCESVERGGEKIGDVDRLGPVIDRAVDIGFGHQHVVAAKGS